MQNRFSQRSSLSQNTIWKHTEKNAIIFSEAVYNFRSWSKNMLYSRWSQYVSVWFCLSVWLMLEAFYIVLWLSCLFICIKLVGCEEHVSAHGLHHWGYCKTIHTQTSCKFCSASHIPSFFNIAHKNKFQHHTAFKLQNPHISQEPPLPQQTDFCFLGPG